MPAAARARIAALVLAGTLVLGGGPTRAVAAAAERPVALETPTGTIHGTLTVPDAIARPPVVLIIAGSGPTDRDGNSPLIAGRNDSLKQLAEALAARGVAALRYDKRGIAASAAAGADEAALRFETYATDAADWIARLAADPAFAGVVVLGHSEGSLVGMLAARGSAARGFVSLAGPAQAAPQVLRRQLQGRLPPELVSRNDAILAALEAGRTVDDIPPALAPLYRPSVQPYLVSWFRYVPTAEIAKLRMPCLVAQGETDIQVGVDDARALHAAGRGCQLLLVAGMNHVLKQVPADPARQLASYGDPSLPVDTELVDAVAGFVKRP